ncbi:hypothetical protein RhiJN_04365 [Ceratobasidium sp. AG-Ba]|nr:hypothetical protein RhiJN_04365 [Ceratobasidium sp. AG-Ba]QRW05254.1 hypothetical protein RhiLY_04253 [Ceratobasidium sp. AG-Ba]
MGLFSWFSKPVENDDVILQALADSITTREAHLSEIRQRERRTSFLFTLYSIGLWVLYSGVWFLNLLPRLEGRQTPFEWTISRRAEKGVYLVPGFAGPFFIYYTRRLVLAWYKGQENKEDRELKKLRGEQKKKIEEIKKKRNYDKTRELIERYETPRKASQEDANMAIRQRAITMTPGTPRTPARIPNPNGNSQAAFNPRPLVPGQPPVAGPQFAPAAAARPVQPPRRGWMDKFADKLLGDDDSTVGIAQSRYALICEKCYSHNGLVKESEWEDVQYRCPKCGHFNLSAKAKKAGITVPPPFPALAGPPVLPPNGAQPSAPDTSEPPSQDEPTPENTDADAS